VGDEVAGGRQQDRKRRVNGEKWRVVANVECQDAPLG